MKITLSEIFGSDKDKRATLLNKELAQAIQADDIPLAGKLLNEGADPNAILMAPRDRALHLAIDYASDPMIDLLLDCGSDVNLACHTYKCLTVSISQYAELAGRPAIAARLREYERQLQLAGRGCDI